MTTRKYSSLYDRHYFVINPDRTVASKAASLSAAEMQVHPGQHIRPVLLLFPTGAAYNPLIDIPADFEDQHRPETRPEMEARLAAEWRERMAQEAAELEARRGQVEPIELTMEERLDLALAALDAQPADERTVLEDYQTAAQEPAIMYPRQEKIQPDEDEPAPRELVEVIDGYTDPTWEAAKADPEQINLSLLLGSTAVIAGVFDPDRYTSITRYHANGTNRLRGYAVKVEVSLVQVEDIPAEAYRSPAQACEVTGEAEPQPEPTQAPACETCKGTGLMYASPDQNGRSVMCPRCHGSGKA